MNKPTNEHEYSKQHMKHGPWTTNLPPPIQKKQKTMTSQQKWPAATEKNWSTYPPKKKTTFSSPLFFRDPSLPFSSQRRSSSGWRVHPWDSPVQIPTSPARSRRRSGGDRSGSTHPVKAFKKTRPFWNPIWLEAETDNKKSQKVKLVVFFLTGALFFRGELGEFFLCSENWGVGGCEKNHPCTWWFKSWPFWDGENVTLSRG